MLLELDPAVADVAPESAIFDTVPGTAESDPRFVAVAWLATVPLVIPVIVADDLQPCDGLPQRAAGRQPPAGMRTCCRAVEPVEEVGGGDHILITTPVDLLVQVTNNVNGQQLRRVVPDLQRETGAVELPGDGTEVRQERSRPLLA